MISELRTTTAPYKELYKTFLEDVIKYLIEVSILCSEEKKFIRQPGLFIAIDKRHAMLLEFCLTRGGTTFWSEPGLAQRFEVGAIEAMNQ